MNVSEILQFCPLRGGWTMLVGRSRIDGGLSDLDGQLIFWHGPVPDCCAGPLDGAAIYVVMCGGL